MEDLILKAVRDFCLIEKGDNITVALSGGADSVSLLHSLLSLKDVLGITVDAAHLNHSIRGEEADRDQKFVEDLCEKLGVKLFCEKADIPKIAKENHLSLELAARQVRYDFLERIARGKVATAHTASDNLETMLFNLARGTSLKGLCGIPTKRGIFIRPIIYCTRQNVEEYCQKNKIAYVTDSTNLSCDYSRNKIRHNVIPILKEINPVVEDLSIRTSLSLNQDNSFLQKTADELLFKICENDGVNVSDFENISPAIAKRVIKKYFEISFPNISLDNKHLNDIYSICLQNSGKLSLPLDTYAVVKNGILTVTDDEKKTVNFLVNITKIQKVNNLFSNDMLDCDKIIGELVIRTRQTGDSIRLAKRGCNKTLKKLFTEYKIPNEQRNTLPVISDENGVVWVYKVGVSSRCAVTEKTKNIFKVEVTETL